MVDPTPYASSAPARVKFNLSERCVATGTACNAGNITGTPSNWPDTPYQDLNCNSGAVCNVHAPTFWSRLRLTSIVTNIWNGTAYTPVDTYTLTHTFPATQDSTSPSLWLSTVQHTGNVGGSQSLPAATFTGSNMPNRVDTADLAPAMNHQRITQIVTETGGKIGIGYTGQQCTAPVTITPANNTSLCYPVYWTREGQTQQKLDWFNKYLVTSVDEQDPTGGAPPLATTYEYVGTPAWHIDDNELTKAKYRTYGQWRGYATVRSRTGSGTEQKTLTETRYFRGMGGTVTLSPDVSWPTGGPANSVTDAEELAGATRETVVYLGDGGAPISASATDYWVGAASATRSRSVVADLTSKITRAVATYGTSAITSTTPTTWRTTKSETTYDTVTGLPKVTYDHGDLAVPSQATCTTITYVAVSPTSNLVNLASEIEKDAKPCGGSGVNGLTAPPTLNRPTDVVSKVRNYYDDPAFDTTWPQAAAPTYGNLTMVRTAIDYTGGAWQFQTSGKKGYDSFGRLTSVIDANGNAPATTTYTQTNGLTTLLQSVNAAGHTSTQTLDPTRGLRTKTLDMNNLEVDLRYDPLGRLTGVWLPGNNTVTNPASIVYQYDISNAVPSAITTKTMNDNGSYRLSVKLFDALTRVRQVQDQAVTGGRLVDDTFYDSHGWTVKTTTAYYDAASVSTTLLNLVGQDNLMPNQDLASYDGIGRVVLATSRRMGVTKWQTQTIYGGDRNTVLGPTGSTPTTTIVDALGRTVEKDYYTTAPSVVNGQVTGGAFTKITYGYDQRGNQSSVTDGASPANTWTSTFDMLGRVTDRTDPDAGASQMKYDANGNVTSGKDSRNKYVFRQYDAINRPIFAYDGPDASSPLMASWTYDSTTITNGIGQMASSTVYDNGYAYTSSIGGYTNRYKPTSHNVNIPADPRNGTLSGDYTFTNTYSPMNGLLTKMAFPATTGALPAETVNHNYNALDQPISVGDLLGAYINSITYNQYGLVSQTQLGTGTNSFFATPIYDDHDLRMSSLLVERTGGVRVDEVTYRTAPTGMVTAIIDKRNDSVTETQCFDHDLLGRLTEAWTATDDCASDIGVTRSNATVGGIDPYWTSWTFNGRGDRATETRNTVPGQTGGPTEFTYNYPASGGSQPHTLTSVTVQGPNGSPSSYGYDTAGNTTTRTTAAGTQVMTWNSQGKLVAVDKNSGAAVSTYTYDTEGNILVQRGPGTVTVYLPDQELTLNTGTGVKTGKRYYKGPLGVTAVRTGTTSTAYSYLIANTQGTASLSVDRTGQNPSWRPFTPYGAPRGTQPSAWPDSHAFLGLPADAVTGLDLIGARQYDPTIGRFVSPDPIFEAADPTQLVRYAYSGNSPVTKSDPTGLIGCTAACIPKNFKECGWGSCEKNASLHGLYMWASLIPVAGTYAIYAEAELYKSEGNQKAADDLMGIVGFETTFTVSMVEPGIFAMPKRIEIALAADAAASGDLATASRVKTGATHVLDACHSFDPATEVLMADGSTRAIKDVKVDDEVLATDPVSGRSTAEKVTDLHLNLDHELTDVTVVPVAPAAVRVAGTPGVEDGAGGVRGPTATLHTTAHHPFWDATAGEWVDAADLRIGHALTGPHGEKQYVVAVRNFAGGKDMRNLTVANVHTYYVMAGDRPILVHNSACKGGTLTVHKFEVKDSDVPHFTVEIRDAEGNLLYHTEQVHMEEGKITAIDPFEPADDLRLLESVTIPIPDAQAAMEFQKKMVAKGAVNQPWDAFTNSCVTHCMNVAQAGGIDILNDQRAFANKLGKSYKWFVQKYI
ncbi:RHS repeat-associated core domain-containing protein [Catellatospora tritici]|uniref:RHS repeat-associated core domain-containing protein n=1 Tax=Catellatospora tritici TaxID=2851566 RepID=UPI001C2D3AE7|nr:RHS repeat-associated core domain-containing protein [Catellatospora tritici]MBV1856755.1 hypothetical protein [Catellatospora tritici]